MAKDNMQTSRKYIYASYLLSWLGIIVYPLLPVSLITLYFFKRKFKASYKSHIDLQECILWQCIAYWLVFTFLFLSTGLAGVALQAQYFEYVAKILLGALTISFFVFIFAYVFPNLIYGWQDLKHNKKATIKTLTQIWK